MTTFCFKYLEPCTLALSRGSPLKVGCSADQSQDAHKVLIRQNRVLARRASELGDDGTDDLVVSEVLRTNELQVWFLSEHLVDVPLVKAKESAASGAA